MVLHNQSSYGGHRAQRDGWCTLRDPGLTRAIKNEHRCHSREGGNPEQKTVIVRQSPLRVIIPLAFAVLLTIAPSLPAEPAGKIIGWGYNNYGQCDVPSPNMGYVATAGGWWHNLGLKANGSIVAWGVKGSAYTTVPDPNSGFVGIAAGPFHSLGLKADGSIVAWGEYSQGQCDVPYGRFEAVAAGGYHSLGLKTDGSVAAWGANDFRITQYCSIITGQCDVPSPNQDYVAIAGGAYHSLGLKEDGSVVAWGANGIPWCISECDDIRYCYCAGCGVTTQGQCTVPLPNKDFVAIAAGYYHSLGLKANGSIVAWGSNQGWDGNYAGQCDVPSPNTGFVAIAAGSYHSLGLKADGSIIVWGLNDHGQCNIPRPNIGFVAVSAGPSHSLALKAEGAIVGKAKLKNFANFAAEWDRTDCGPLFWCNGQDINRSGAVDIDDLLAFSTYWLTE